MKVALHHSEMAFYHSSVALCHLQMAFCHHGKKYKVAFYHLVFRYAIGVVEKQKSRQLARCAGLQLPRALTSAGSKIMIHDLLDDVKICLTLDNFEKEEYTKSEYIS